MSIHLIVAMTKNQVIGNNNTLLWHLPEDMKLFKEHTTGNVVIMGKNTWESLPQKFRPLPNRENIILSTSLSNASGATICKTVEDALSSAKKSNKEIYCIGGAQTYALFLPNADVLHISWVKKEYVGNVYFPEVNWKEWKEVETKEYADFVYKKYVKK